MLLLWEERCQVSEENKEQLDSLRFELMLTDNSSSQVVTLVSYVFFNIT